jgi:hypothetical protein
VNRLADLLEKQKSLILTDTTLLKFNKVVGKDIEILGKVIGLAPAEIDIIRMENPLSGAAVIHKIIVKWKNKNKRNATLGKFKELLMGAEDAGASVDWDKFYEGVSRI